MRAHGDHDDDDGPGVHHHYHHHIHHEFPPAVEQALREILHSLQSLTGKVNAMSAELDRAVASVAALVSVVDSAEALLGQLADLIRALPAERAAINKLADDVDAQRNELAAAVAANTPAAPTP